MPWDEVNACDNRFSQGEEVGRLEASRGLGKRDVSRMLDPFYAEGYSVGYDSYFLALAA